MSARNLCFVVALLSCSRLDARDWVTYPAVVERGPAPTTLYALGDIHGDYERLVKLLAGARIIPGKPANPQDVAWSAGTSVLVVTGDMIDKGPHPVDVLRLLAALRAAAPKQGGRVILLAGNHEAEFLAEPGAKKAADFLADLKRYGIPAGDVAGCKGGLGEFLCTLPFAARVGDWFFSHGGNTDGRTIARLAADLRDGVDKSGFATPQLTGDDSILEARLGDGKKWFAGADEHGVLAADAAALGVKHMVQGHQHNNVRFADGVERHTGEMFQRWGLLFLIDVGMSEGVGDSHGALLRIAAGRAVAVCANGRETLLWGEAAQMDSARAAPCGKSD